MTRVKRRGTEVRELVFEIGGQCQVVFIVYFFHIGDFAVPFGSDAFNVGVEKGGPSVHDRGFCTVTVAG